MTLALDWASVSRAASVMKTRSPQTTGLEKLRPAKATFQSTFSFFFPPQVRGRPFSSVWPSPVGPRQAGQLPARLAVAASARLTQASRREERSARHEAGWEGMSRVLTDARGGTASKVGG